MHNQVKSDNQLDIHLVYWSVTRSSVTTVYLKSLPLFSATGESIFNTVKEEVEECVSINSVVALGTDGHNTMKTDYLMNIL